MTTNVIGEEVDDVLRRTLGTGGAYYLLAPSAELIEELTAIGLSAESFPTVKLVAEPAVLRAVRNDFLVASDVADLVERDDLELRTYDGEQPARDTLLVGESAAHAIVSAGGEAAALGGDDAAFLDDVRTAAADTWADAEPFDLRTPGRTRVDETLDEALGERVQGEFDAMLNSLATARGRGDELNEVTVALLAAARDERLLYDLSKWGENVGLASKATFSRVKTDLEELGILTTEKQPVDVGRPRQRLLLARDELDEATPEELASIVRSMA